MRVLGESLRQRCRLQDVGTLNPWQAFVMLVRNPAASQMLELNVAKARRHRRSAYARTRAAIWCASGHTHQAAPLTPLPFSRTPAL